MVMSKLMRLFAVVALLVPLGTRPALAQQTSQELTVNALGGEPDNIDPNRSSFSNEAAVIRQVFEPLLRFDANLVPQPAAAESYEVSPDGLTYTFHLRPDGRWSDGLPVAAEHFEYSWKRILDPKTAGQYGSFLVDAGVVGAEEFNAGATVSADILGIRALDDLTFEIRLEHPFGPLPNLAALIALSPLRRDTVDANSASWAQDPATYIGNGPFMMSEWVHQDHITMVPNPNYVAHFQWPAPTLQQLTLLMVTSGEANFAAYLNGERDWTLTPDPDVHLVLSDPELSLQARQYSQLVTKWVQVNNGRAPLDNLLVRRALSKAIDRSALVRDIYGGVGLPATSILPPGMPGFQEGLGQERDFDPQGGRALLDEAGYLNGSGFPRLTFAYPSGSGNQRSVEFLQAQWKRNLNIDVELDPMENKAYQAAFKNKSFELTLIGWTADYPDPQDWFSTLFGCKSTNNMAGYCSPAFDALVSQADRGVDLEDRLALYKRAQTQLIQDAPVLPLNVNAGLVVIKPYVQMIDGAPLVITAADDYPGDYFLDMVHILPH